MGYGLLICVEQLFGDTCLSLKTCFFFNEYDCSQLTNVIETGQNHQPAEVAPYSLWEEFDLSFVVVRLAANHR